MEKLPLFHSKYPSLFPFPIKVSSSIRPQIEPIHILAYRLAWGTVTHSGQVHVYILRFLFLYQVISSSAPSHVNKALNKTKESLEAVILLTAEDRAFI